MMMLALGALMLMAGCKDKGRATAEVAAASDSTGTKGQPAVAPNDTTPLPMFLCCFDKEHMQVAYWYQLEKPKNTENESEEQFRKSHEEWYVQDAVRRNRALYTKLFLDEKNIVDIRYAGEVLTTPDGNEAYYGTLHSRASIPMQGLRYELTDPDVEIDNLEGALLVMVTDDYLKSRKQLECTYDEQTKAFPPSVLEKLEKQYGMTVSQSMMVCHIDGRYDFGMVQFKPKDKQVLALEVLVDGSQVYSYPVKGYYESETSFGWNVDDEGEYNPSSIEMAFMGPHGLELCYKRFCVESLGVGLFRLHDGQFTREQYTLYQYNIPDEKAPLWKRDAAQMRKLYLEHDPHENKGRELTKYFFVDIDNDGFEEYWLRDKDEKQGALFTCRQGKIALIGIDDGRRQVSFRRGKGGTGYAVIAGSAGGPSMYYEVYKIDHSQVTQRFTALEIYGEMSECTLNGNKISPERGTKYLKSLPKVLDPYVYWLDIDNQEQ